MNSNFMLSINIVLPLFLLMGVGFLFKRIRLLDETTTKVMNNLVFRLFLPVYLARAIMKADLQSLMNPNVFLFIGVGVTSLYLVLLFVVPRIEKQPASRGVMIQAIGRSNYALFGIPLVSAIFPGVDTSLASLLVIINIPLTNAFSVYALESNREGKAKPKTIAMSIAKNPLIVSSLIGLLLLMLKPPMPAFVITATDEMAKIATPLALFLLGASIDPGKVGGNLRKIAICVTGKLLIAPGILLTAAVLMGFRSVELACIMVSFAAPTAVNSYTMALIMGGDAELAAECVVFSTAFSALTVFLFVYIFLQMGLF